MKKSILYSVIAIIIFAFANFNFISPVHAQEKTVESVKHPGAIIIGIPPGCDCTAPANTCYCEVKGPKKPKPSGE